MRWVINYTVSNLSPVVSPLLYLRTVEDDVTVVVAMRVQCGIIVPSLVTGTLKEIALVRVVINQRVYISTALHREPISLELARNSTLTVWCVIGLVRDDDD